MHPCGRCTATRSQCVTLMHCNSSAEDQSGTDDGRTQPWHAQTAVIITASKSPHIARSSDVQHTVSRVLWLSIISLQCKATLPLEKCCFMGLGHSVRILLLELSRVTIVSVRHKLLQTLSLMIEHSYYMERIFLTWFCFKRTLPRNLTLPILPPLLLTPKIPTVIYVLLAPALFEVHSKLSKCIPDFSVPHSTKFVSFLPSTLDSSRSCSSTNAILGSCKIDLY